MTRYWWQIMAGWIIGSTALVAMVYSQIKPVYEAVATLRAEPKPQELFGYRVSMGDANNAFLETQVQLITSTNVLTTVQQKPEINRTSFLRSSQDPVSDIKKALQVSVVPNTYLIRVAMRSPSAEEAALTVSEVVKS